MTTYREPGKEVVLLSGGVDSATALAIAHAEGRDLYALSVDYGQRHLRELESAKNIAEYFGVKQHLIIDFNLRDIGGSALTSDIEVPKSGVSEKGIRDQGLGLGGENLNPQPPTPNLQSSIPVTYVPARNTIFLSFALAWAEVLEAEHI